ncbi:amino acid ABC transporter substrate-binding protein [Proteocatella sphenisci]|uniref:amino acid ABC transporter substrate-binding protein n=1 Tax=Proteocatella sphenisci TaxID=181070 RepID=UPI0004919F5F|nr:amino acid ABC transporter substrate-binding protein [Proteocatella sphenisci]
MKKIKRFMAVTAAVLTMVTGFTACSSTDQTASADTWADLEAQGYFTMGLDDTFAPMGFRDADGNLTGFDVDLAQEVADRIGLEVKMQPIDWSMKETELNAGNIDVIWNGYTITDARKEKVNFSTPYLNNRQIIVTLADSPVNTKSDLAGLNVAVQKESSAYEAVIADAEFTASLNDSEPIQFDTNNEAFMDLEAGRTDAIVVDEVLARYYMKLRGQENYKVLEDNFGEEEYAVGIRKSDALLLEKINAAFEEMQADGTYTQINDKWFSEN